MTSKLSFQVRPDGQGPFQAMLEITTQYHDVSTIQGVQVPNLAWEFVDEAGHYHAWAKDETLPTLDRHVTHEAESEENNWEGYSRVVTVCKLCAEPVEPAYNTDHTPKAIPGKTFWEASIYGVHLPVGGRVSLSFSEPATGHVRYFGIGTVLGNGLETHEGGATYVTKMYGDGPLARKK